MSDLHCFLLVKILASIFITTGFATITALLLFAVWRT